MGMKRHGPPPLASGSIRYPITEYIPNTRSVKRPGKLYLSALQSVSKFATLSQRVTDQTRGEYSRPYQEEP
jgi:hypothetical protein